MSEELNEDVNEDTFVVKVLHKEKEEGTLKGEVHWLEGNRTQNFRSAMELMYLIVDASDEEGKLRRWEGRL